MRTASMKRLLSSPIIAVVAGLALRLFFVLLVPTATGDTFVYEQLAENWLKRGIYGLFVAGQLTPVDIRMPGYPAYLAFAYWVCGHTGAAARFWVMLGQVAMDLATAVLVVLLATRILANGVEERPNVRRRAMWLAFTCPFVANYTAVPLTEVFATFFTAAALLFFVLQLQSAGNRETSLAAAAGRKISFGVRLGPELLGVSGALLAGFGTLFRPETPLLVAVPCVVLGSQLLWQRRIARWILPGVLTALACLVPLSPWIVRNALSLHEFQPLAPRYAQLPGELVTRGFIAWEKTWLWRFRDVYLVSWKLDEQPFSLSDIPESAFDTAEEKQRVATLLSEYNDTTTLTSEEDGQFSVIARERTSRRPLSTYLR